MADQVLVTDPEAVKTIEKYAEQKEISKAESAARLIRTAKGRINAVRKFAAKSAENKPKRVRKAKAEKKVEATPPRRRGRPPGSKNKPKVPVAEAPAAPAAAPPAPPAALPAAPPPEAPATPVAAAGAL